MINETIKPTKNNNSGSSPGGVGGVLGNIGGGKSIVPLFRITVAWEIDKKQEVRVYEARSPQQAWQAAVLEKIGISENENENEKNLKNLKKKSEDRILLPMNGSVLLYDQGIVINSERLKLIYDGNKDSESIGERTDDVLTGSAVDPRMSPLGNSVAFVVNGDLYVQHVRTSSSNHSYDGK